jgi:ABC-type transporter Mla subunit MlaD
MAADWRSSHATELYWRTAMTIDERFARIEHVTAGLAERSVKDRDELRGLWRDTQRQLDQLTGRVDAIATHLDTFITETAARDRETDRRFRETDARIDKLISAMGEFLRQSAR